MLEKIKAPSDVKKLTIPELEELSADIRKNIIDTVDANGGHLSPNLGAVELTVALYRVFDFPTDKLIFDVGHQCYFPKACMTHSGRGMREVLFRRALGIVLQEMRASRIIR